jgi:flagellar basal-body rod modification protein FlgD
MPSMGIPDQVSDQRPYQNIKMQSTIGLDEKKSKEKVLENIQGKSNKNSLLRGPNNQMGKDEFMKILTHQIQNQDPFAPHDPTKASAEMAQYAQLEQLMNIEKALLKQEKANDLSPRLMAGQLIGKKVTALGDKIQYDGISEETKFQYRLDKNADKVMIRILDQKGQTVFQDTLAMQQNGQHEYTWPGTMINGFKALKGDYTLSISAYDENAQPVKTETKTSGNVQSVSFEQDMIWLYVDGKKISLSMIDSIESTNGQTVSMPTLNPKILSKNPEQSLDTYKNMQKIPEQQDK